MATPKFLLYALGAVLIGPILATAQVPAAPAPPRPIPVQPGAPSPIDPPIVDPNAVPQALPAPIPGSTTTTTVQPLEASTESPDTPRVFEFQGEELSLVLRTLARAAKMNIL